MLTKQFNDLVSEVAAVARREGLPVFLVGGSVRRLLGGGEQTDLDLVVDAPRGAAQLGAALAEALPGCSRPAAISSFPTVELRCGGQTVQISEPLRKIALDISSVGAPLSETMKQDALVRDFTVNTLLIPVGKADPAQIIDPLGSGRDDLGKRILRTPMEPGYTLANDPLRMLRAVRFLAVEEFELDPALRRAILAGAPKIAGMPGERIGQELTKILTGPRPAEGVRALRELELLRHILPELEELASVEQPTQYHGDDALSHTLKVLDGVGPRLRVRLAALFHDLGKSSTSREMEGRVVFHGHQHASAAGTRAALRRLRYSRKEIEEVARLVEMHMLAYRPEWSDKAVRRLVRRAGALLDDLTELYRADILARRPPHNNPAEFEHLAARLRAVDQEGIRSASSPLTGEEVMDLLEIGQCPQVGEAQRAVEKAIVDDRIPAEREAARRFLLEQFVPRLQGRGATP